MKNSNDIIGDRTRDLLTCGVVPQPTALQRTATIEQNFLFLLAGNSSKKKKRCHNWYCRRTRKIVMLCFSPHYTNNFQHLWDVSIYHSREVKKCLRKNSESVITFTDWHDFRLGVCLDSDPENGDFMLLTPCTFLQSTHQPTSAPNKT